MLSNSQMVTITTADYQTMSEMNLTGGLPYKHTVRMHAFDHMLSLYIIFKEKLAVDNLLMIFALGLLNDDPLL